MFKNKANILLSIFLVGLLSALGYFGYRLYTNQDKILVPDFSNKTYTDVVSWCNSLDNNPCTITRDYSDSVEKDYVIYQSIGKDEELVSSISFIVSDGKKPQEITIMQVGEDCLKQDVEKWAEENNITNITYIDETNDLLASGYVIRIEPNDVCSLDEIIKVYVSSGSKIVNSKEIEVEKNAYIGLTISQFEAKMKELGLNPKYASKKDEYSSTVKKGNIVWHGNGSYINGEDIRYGLSLGESDLITVTSSTYVGLSLQEFETKVKQLGLVASHSENKDATSSDVKEGYIVWHGSGTYEKNEEIHYGLSKGIGNEIIVKSGTYKGISLEEFESKVKELTLTPTHASSKDDYSSTIEKGKIIWHGSGTYEKNENIRYGLSLGPDPNNIVVTSGDYVGKTYEEFETLVKKLGTNGLVPKHVESRDSYSDSIAKGSIVWHGSGKYKDNENISYGLSLGSKPKVDVASYANKSESEFLQYLSNNDLLAGSKTTQYSDSVDSGKIISNTTGSYSIGSSINYVVSLGKDNRVTVSSKENTSESSFISYLTQLGLTAGNRSEQSSSSIAKGNIISNQTGTFNKGDSVNYVVSSGKKQIYLNSKTIYNDNNVNLKSFDETKTKMTSLLAGFSNVTYNKVQSYDRSIGQIDSISVNGSTTYEPGYYDSDTKIVVNIVNSN